MLRADALQAIYPELKDRIVVTIMGAVAAELYTIGHRPNFFYLEHAMGLASSMGLGIALAMPQHKVIVIDGDGSLLMNLGTLSTMARYKPGNLLHLVFDNESLLSVGGFPTATSTGTDLAGIARASGIPSVIEANTLESLQQSVKDALASNTLTTIISKVEAVGPKTFHMDLPLLENRFQFWRCLQGMKKQAESEPYILHITRREQWGEAKREGYFKGDTLGSQGFIHFSKPHQVEEELANFLFEGQKDLVLLIVDTSKVQAEIRYETMGNEVFPHLYGPLNTDAVIEVLDLVPDDSGKFQLPRGVSLLDKRRT
jgi:sulfopyruvate decarboxylase subunit beta